MGIVTGPKDANQPAGSVFASRPARKCEIRFLALQVASKMVSTGGLLDQAVPDTRRKSFLDAIKALDH
jgi:hypothetical protein